MHNQGPVGKSAALAKNLQTQGEAKRCKIVAGVASVLGARAALRGKLQEHRPKLIADFAALRFAADQDVPLKTEPLPLSTWGDELRKLISAPRGVPIKKVVLGGFLWPSKTAIFVVDFSKTPDEVKNQRINARATALIQCHAVDTNEIPIAVYGAALWISPGRGNLFDDNHKSMQNPDTQFPNAIRGGSIDGATAARALMAQDADARAARKAIHAAVQAFREIRIERVMKAKTLWRKQARSRLKRLLPWLERARRAVRGSGILTVSDQSDYYKCIRALRAHAENSTPQNRSDVFDTAVSRIRHCQYLPGSPMSFLCLDH